MTFTRVRAMIFVAVLFVTAGIVVLTAINKDTQTLPQTQRCSAGDVRANISVPEDRKQVTINVYNGTSQVGLAERIGGEFANRGFVVAKTATAPPEKAYTDVALITFGPEAVGAAWLVGAYFLDEAKMEFVRDRSGAEVDVTLGDHFQQLATTTEVNQAIAQKGSPELYPGTCAA